MPEPKPALRSVASQGSRSVATIAAAPVGGTASALADVVRGEGGVAAGLDGPDVGATAGEIFLSPRIVDRQAFNDYSLQLRGIIEESLTAADALRAAIGGADGTRDRIQAAAADQAKKLETAAKALAAADQRATQAGKLLETAQSATVQLVELKRAAEEQVAAGLGTLRGELASAGAAARADEEALRGRIAALVQGAQSQVGCIEQSLTQSLAPAIRTIAGLCTRAEGLTKVGSEGSLPGAIERAEKARVGLEAVIASCEPAAAVATAAARGLQAAIDGAAPATTAINSARGAVDRAVIEARRAADDVLLRATRSADELGAGLDQRLAGARAAGAAVGEEVRGITGESQTLLDQLTGATHAAARMTDRAEEMLARLEPWAAILTAEDPGPPKGDESDAPLPPVLKRLIDQVRLELRKDLGGIAAAMRSLADHTARAVDQ